MKVNYPADLLEFESITYWKGWVPVVRPNYDENDATMACSLKPLDMLQIIRTYYLRCGEIQGKETRSRHCELWRYLLHP